MNYRNAYKEVYEILQELDEENHNKIPKDIIKVFEENKNEEYEFHLDDELELKEQDLLPETKAILYNLFRDYLSEPWQKEKIVKWQNEEKQRNEELKKQKYNTEIFNKKACNQNDCNSINNAQKEKNTNLLNMENSQLLMEYKENIFKKVINYIKNLFK